MLVVVVLCSLPNESVSASVNGRVPCTLYVCVSVCVCIGLLCCVSSNAFCCFFFDFAQANCLVCVFLVEYLIFASPGKNTTIEIYALCLRHKAQNRDDANSMCAIYVLPVLFFLSSISYGTTNVVSINILFYILCRIESGI